MTLVQTQRPTRMHIFAPAVSSAQTPSPRHRRFSVEWLVLVTVQLVIATTVATVLVREERSTRNAELARLESRAKIVDDNLSQQLEGADRALLGVADAIAELEEVANAAPITARLKMLTAAMPGFSSMLWLGPDGTVRASSNDILIGKNFAKREYFAAPVRVGDPVRLYVSPPFLSSLGTYVIVVSRMLIDSQGAFGGVVTATLDPKYFSVLLRSVLHAPDMRAALVHSDGAVFLYLPGEATVPGTQPPELPALLAVHRQQPGGRTANDAGTLVGGSLRLVELRSLDRDEPLHEQKLLVMLSRELPAVLAPWQAQAQREVALLLLLVLITSGSLWLDQRRRHAAHAKSASAIRDLQAAAERVDQALRGADLGLWELHVPTETFVINARERTLLGYRPDDDLPQGPAWRRLIHPDDRAQVDMAIVPHLEGSVPAYEIEHRMLHCSGHYVWVFSRAMIVERGPKGEPIRIVGTHLDITDRKSAAMKQALNERRLKAINDNVPALVAHLDREQCYLTANEELRRIFGIDPATMLGRTLRAVRGEAVYAQMAPHVNATLAGETRRFELTDTIRGVLHHFQHSFVPDIDQAGAVQGFYSVSFDITAAKETQRQLEELARVDTLTGLPNRRQFDERLEQALQRSHRSAQHVAVMYLDIDHFKAINDSLGHSGGDTVLKEFGLRLKASVRETDLAARLAGDEFVVLLEGLTIEHDACSVAQKIVDAMRVDFAVADTSLRVTTSLGVGFSSDASATAADLMACADRALYEAKRAGRDGFRLSNFGVLQPTPSLQLKSADI